MAQASSMNDDIIFLILISLPAVEAYKFRQVCKSWYYMIKSPAFVHAHLRKAKHGLICNKENGIDNTIYNDKIQLREFDEKSRTIWGSCNGLVLLDQIVQTARRRFLFIANPVTQEVIIKLPSPYSHNVKAFSHVFGITYVASVKRYVVVHYFIMQKGNQQLGNLTSDFGCETLSVGDDEWERVFYFRTNTGMEFFWSAKVIFINDVAYMVVLEWIDSFSSHLISLNMIDRKVYKTSMPDNHKDLFEIGGVLSYTRLCNDADFEIWSLGDFRTGDWVMHTRIETRVNGFAGSVVATLEKGRIIIGTYYDFAATRKDDVGYFAYDIQLEQTAYLDFKPQQTGCRLLHHVDSLVSCIEVCQEGETSAT